ncbi:hypothetical protein IFM89_032234 [Coptis chinensis]|uniref:Biotin carboxyl carrier protein n=1 Tax=Coptis chinensis TaxID=261450 RepID=A0A835LT25_9MAGN|nr:hypothetical protein IFM89_032234 [Coptis chinensis]
MKTDNPILLQVKCSGNYSRYSARVVYEGSLKSGKEVAIKRFKPTTVPSKPVAESAPTSSQPSPPKETISPFKYVSPEKSSKLASLEASGSNGYVLVSSPTVGSIQIGRTVKGKKQPPVCKVGDVIKEGQIIGYLDQFGTKLPVKSDVAREVLKLLFSDGEAIGYGDPLLAVLPSFHGIKD